MRLVLTALVLLAVAGCDTTTSEERPPETETIGVTVTYRVTVSGASTKTTVSYTDAEGQMTTEPVDFNRSGSYVQTIEFEPGAMGTVSLAGRGLVSSGRIGASIVVERTDTGDEVASVSETSTTTGVSEFASATVTLDLPVVTVTEDE